MDTFVSPDLPQNSRIISRQEVEWLRQAVVGIPDRPSA